MNFEVIILGAGGHASVLVDALKYTDIRIIGYTAPKSDAPSIKLSHLQLIGDDSAVFKYPAEQIRLVNGLGSVGSNVHRRRVFQSFKNKGYFFANIIHPSAVIAPDVLMGEGVQVMAGTIIQTGSRIGENTIVNTRASVDHDCIIGSHVHLAPGVVLSGGVQVEEGVHIGTGATVIQGIRIGKNSIVGAGSLVIKDIPEETISLGVPARVVNNEKL